MDYCDKCGEEISKLEPCFQINYGFLVDEDTFQAEPSYVLLHIDCLSDAETLSIILNNIEKH